MNSCPQAERFVDYCLGELTGKEKEDFERHLKSCVICQQELQVEMAIRKELSEEFNPGFIEHKIRVRLQLGFAQDTQSFWLYAFRMAVWGITALIAGFVLIPMLMKFLLGITPNLSQFTRGVAELLSNLAPGNVFLVILGFCYISVFIASMYSFAQIRR
jgi:hypothetical protein